MKSNKEIYQRCRRELENSSTISQLKVASRYCDLFIFGLDTDEYWTKVYHDQLLEDFKRCLKKLSRP